MCAIGHYLELEGIMTTSISLVRENAEALRPPRSLWVSFPLGRPLGKPNDADFQHQVIRHALDLLQEKEGPVLQDFPFGAPAIDIEHIPACPVNFARADERGNSWVTKLANELTQLRPWYDLSRRRRNRTTVGVCDSSIDEILTQLGIWLDSPERPIDDFRWFKSAIEDAKAFYSEALTAQPGEYPLERIRQQLWDTTALGAALKLYYQRFSQHPKLSLFAGIVAPRTVMGAARD